MIAGYSTREIVATLIAATLLGGCSAHSPETSDDESEEASQREGEASASEETSRPKPPDSLEKGDYVLLAPETTLRLTGNRESWETTGDEPVVAAFVSTEERWIRVRGVTDLRDHDCSSVDGAYPSVRFEAFVTADDLQRVVRASASEEYDDGSAWEVNSGLPVEPVDGSSGFEVRADDVRAELPISSDAVGWTFEPATPFEVKPEKKVEVPEKQLDAGTVADGRPVSFDDSTILGSAEERSDGSHLVGATAPCLEVRARFAPDVALEIETLDGGWGGMGLRGSGGGLDVEEGAEIVTPDGVRVGTAGGALRLQQTDERDGRVCGDINIHWLADGSARGCVDAAATE